MNALLLAVAVLAADPTAAEQKLIDKAKAELKSARVKAGGPLLAKIDAAKADLEAIDEGEIDPGLKQTMVRKVVKGKPTYKFRHETYRAKEKENAEGVIHSTNRTNDMDVTPSLNLLGLKIGAKGRLNFFVNDAWTCRIKENEPDADGVTLLVAVAPSGTNRSIDLRLRIKGVMAVSDDGRLSCVVTGVKKVHGQAVYQLLAVEQFGSQGNLIGD